MTVLISNYHFSWDFCKMVFVNCLHISYNHKMEDRYFTSFSSYSISLDNKDTSFKDITCIFDFTFSKSYYICNY